MNKAQNTNRSRDEKFWKEQISDFNALNISPKEFCSRSGLSLSSFRYWRRQLESSAEQPEGIQFLEVSAELLESTPHNPPQSPPDRETPPVVITLGRLTVNIYNQADPAVIEAVLKGMRT